MEKLAICPRKEIIGKDSIEQKSEAVATVHMCASCLFPAYSLLHCGCISTARGMYIHESKKRKNACSYASSQSTNLETASDEYYCYHSSDSDEHTAMGSPLKSSISLAGRVSTSNSTPRILDILPRELLVTIASFVRHDTATRTSLALSCKEFHEISIATEKMYGPRCGICNRLADYRFDSATLYCHEPDPKHPDAQIYANDDAKKQLQFIVAYENDCRFGGDISTVLLCRSAPPGRNWIRILLHRDCVTGVALAKQVYHGAGSTVEHSVVGIGFWKGVYPNLWLDLARSGLPFRSDDIETKKIQCKPQFMQFFKKLLDHWGSWTCALPTPRTLFNRPNETYLRCFNCITGSVFASDTNATGSLCEHNLYSESGVVSVFSNISYKLTLEACFNQMRCAGTQRPQAGTASQSIANIFLSFLKNKCQRTPQLLPGLFDDPEKIKKCYRAMLPFWAVNGICSRTKIDLITGYCAKCANVLSITDKVCSPTAAAVVATVPPAPGSPDNGGGKITRCIKEALEIGSAPKAIENEDMRVHGEIRSRLKKDYACLNAIMLEFLSRTGSSPIILNTDRNEISYVLLSVLMQRILDKIPMKYWKQYLIQYSF